MRYARKNIILYLYSHMAVSQQPERAATGGVRVSVTIIWYMPILEKWSSPYVWYRRYYRKVAFLGNSVLYELCFFDWCFQIYGICHLEIAQLYNNEIIMFCGFIYIYFWKCRLTFIFESLRREFKPRTSSFAPRP